MRLAWITLFGMLACSSGNPGGGSWGGAPSVSVPATVVQVVEAAVGSVSDLLITNATVESERQADVIPQTTGMVREVRAAEGDAVQSGQVLAVIDNISLDESANRAVAELRRLEAELEVSRRLVEERAMAQRELEELEGRVLGARSTLREARVTARQTKLVAPFDGVVGVREIREGEVATSSTRAFQIVDLDALVIMASLPERDVSRVRIGQSARAVSAYDPDLSASATVERIAPIIDASSGTFRVQLRLEPDQRALRPGQFVSVSIEVDRHEDVVVVPKRALVYEDGKPVIYRKVRQELTDEERAQAQEAPHRPASGWGWLSGSSGAVDPDPDTDLEEAPAPSPYVAERVRVQVGLIDERNAELTEGIAPGDEVVVLGQSALKDGARIRVAEEPTATADPDAPAQASE